MNPLPVKFLLIVATKPTAANEANTGNKWRDFLETCKTRNALPPECTKLLHDNIWLLPITDAIRWLTNLNPIAEHFVIPLHLYFLAEEPEWFDFAAGISN